MRSTFRVLFYTKNQSIKYIKGIYYTVSVDNGLSCPIKDGKRSRKQPGTPGRVRVKFALTLFICPHSPLEGRRIGSFKKTVIVVRAG